MKLTHYYQHIDIDADGADAITHFNTELSLNDRIDFRVILKCASQSPAFTKTERNLALRLITELDQLELEL